MPDTPTPWPQRLVTRRELQLMLALLALIAVVAVTGRMLPCVPGPAVVAFWVMLWAPMLALMFWRQRLARRAWLRVYLLDESPWSTRLRGGVLMLAGQALVSAVLAVTLMVSLARGVPAATWIVLVLLVPLWAKAWSGLGRYLRRHASAEFLPLVSARLLVRLTAGVLLIGLATRGLWQPVADLGQVTLYEAVRHFSSLQAAESPRLERLLVITATLDGTRLWVLQRWVDGLPGGVLQLLAWMLVLIREWLFIWPWLLLCEAVSHVVYRHGSPHPSGV
jgi:hypothetical protein